MSDLYANDPRFTVLTRALAAAKSDFTKIETHATGIVKSLGSLGLWHVLAVEQGFWEGLRALEEELLRRKEETP